MKGIMPPQRGGRPNKVVKSSATPSTPSRGRARPTPHANTHHNPEPDELKQPEYDDGALIMNELNVATAAAAAAAAAAAIDAAENAELGDADAEMDDDDPELHHQPHHDHSGDSMDLNTAANILANGGSVTSTGQLTPAPSSEHQQQHQHHQLQQQQHHHHHPHHQPPAPMGGPSPHPVGLDPASHHAHANLDPSFVRTTEELARDSGYGQLNVESALAKRLAREPGLRLAQQRRPDQQLNLQRRSNVEALFAHIAGEMAPAACKNCHKGHGPWTSCVVVDGQMCGSCANCWFNASGARCSFHETRNPQAHHPSLLSTPSASDPNASYVLHATPGVPPPPPAQQQQQQQQQPPPPHLSAAGHGGAGSSATLAALSSAAGGSNDPVVRYTVERAVAEVRGADRRTRQIMMIEIAAKQLALQIVEYEESGGGGGSVANGQPQLVSVGVAGGGQNGGGAGGGGGGGGQDGNGGNGNGPA